MQTCPVMGKICFKTPEEAHRAADIRMSHGDAPDLAVYKCPWCRSWHLTKNLHPMKRIKALLEQQYWRKIFVTADYADHLEPK